MAISKSKREAVYRKYDGHCAYCGRKIAHKDMQVDHFLPLRARGIEAAKHAWAKGLEPSQYIEALSAADVAPVVRCKDCTHLVAANVNGKGIPTCRVSGMEVALDEFCSRGKKGQR